MQIDITKAVQKQVMKLSFSPFFRSSSFSCQSSQPISDVAQKPVLLNLAEHIKYTLATLLSSCCMAPVNQQATAIMIKNKEDGMGNVGKEALMVEDEIVHAQQKQEQLLEWDVEFDEAVMVTLVAQSHGGCNRIKRIRFRNHQFCPAKARSWWVKNSDKVIDLFNVERSDLGRYNSVMGIQRSNPAQEISSTSANVSSGPRLEAWEENRDQPGPSLEAWDEDRDQLGPNLEAWEEDRDQCHH